MFLNNPIFSEEFCFSIYAKNKTEAFEKVKEVINRRTNVDVQNKEFIEFDFDPQKFDTHQKIEEYVKQLLKKEKLNAKNYPIGYFKTHIRDIESCDIVGVNVKKEESKPYKFVTVYHVKTSPFERDNCLNEYKFSKTEAINLAKQHASQYDTEVTIEKKMVLDNGDPSMLIATITPKKKYHYGKKHLYYFFGIDEVNKKRYLINW